MARKSNPSTTLWSVIENMQRQLEAEGLDRDVVDAAVARGIESLLDLTVQPSGRVIPKPRKGRPTAWIPRRVLAKA